MTRHELEADNIVLISIVEKNIKVMQRAANILSILQNYERVVTPAAIESLDQIKISIAGSREFLDKLFQEANYPQQ
ncbi:MAG: hypothetical protein RBR45_11960 [Pseudomonas sp.]|jgi:hypothetical protein|nr:hypothetical protein [Pseudomonas sp.]